METPTSRSFKGGLLYVERWQGDRKGPPIRNAEIEWPEQARHLERYGVHHRLCPGDPIVGSTEMIVRLARSADGPGDVLFLLLTLLRR